MHADPNGQSRHHSLLGRGLYHRQVTRLRAAIPAANVLIVKSEAFFGAQYETFRDICAFLGVGAPDRASFAEDHANRGAKLRPMRRVEWRRLRDLFADDVGRLAAELDWDCDDWLAEPAGLTD
jgi:hypothetical protein